MNRSLKRSSPLRLIAGKMEECESKIRRFERIVGNPVYNNEQVEVAKKALYRLRRQHNSLISEWNIAKEAKPVLIPDRCGFVSEGYPAHNTTTT